MNLIFPCLYKNPSKSIIPHLYPVMQSNLNLFSNPQSSILKEKLSPNLIDVTLNSCLSSFKISIKIKSNGNLMINKFKNKVFSKSHKIKVKLNLKKNFKSKSVLIHIKLENIIINCLSLFIPKKYLNHLNMLMSS